MDSTTLIDEDDFNKVQDLFREERQSRLEEFIALGKKSERVHASYLFYFGNAKTDPVILPLCLVMYDTLVMRIGGTQQSGRTAGWMDLGTGLGIGVEYLKYINNNHNIICQTEMVLKMFANEEDATFGKIINVLMEIERLDVIEGLFESLNKLIEELCHKNKSEQDLGYHSITSKDGSLDIFRPKKEILMIDLPRVLQRNKANISVSSNSKGNDPPRESNPFVSSSLLDSEEICGPSVMLTYSEDAIASAQNVLNKIMNFDNGSSKINVVSLDRLASSVIASPENCIRRSFEKVDYIIPILTEKYVDAISSHSTTFDCGSYNLDCKYATFVYNLMSTHYTNGTGCINTKVRPLLSQRAGKDLYNRLSTYPLFSVWFRENEVEKLLSAIFQGN